jgi:hypothetical protein
MPLPMMRIRMRMPTVLPPYSAGIFFRIATRRHFLTATSLTPTTTTTTLRLRSAALLYRRYGGASLRHRTFALPLFHQQTSSYGRFAFHDVSSDDDSDIQFAASSHSQPRSQQQSVYLHSTLLHLLLFFSFLHSYYYQQHNCYLGS